MGLGLIQAIFTHKLMCFYLTIQKKGRKTWVYLDHPNICSPTILYHIMHVTTNSNTNFQEKCKNRNVFFFYKNNVSNEHGISFVFWATL